MACLWSIPIAWLSALGTGSALKQRLLVFRSDLPDTALSATLYRTLQALDDTEMKDKRGIQRDVQDHQYYPQIKRGIVPCKPAQDCLKLVIFLSNLIWKEFQNSFSKQVENF